MALIAPFSYFGGKSIIANKVWNALGDCNHYIEPFFGSGAVLLSRPNNDATRHIETVNDKDGFIANVWRSLQAAPDEVAKYCDWPVNHADLNARRITLLANEARLIENLCADPEWYDAKIAGYWIWATSSWIGSGLTRPNAIPFVAGTGKGVHKISQRPHIGHAGQGVHKISQRPHIGHAGQGVHKISQRPNISNAGNGVQDPYNPNIYTWFRALSERLRYVRVVCGDWKQVCGGNWQNSLGLVGMFFDPPYSSQDRADVYHHESKSVALEVAEWAIARGKLPDYRIVVCGYDDEHSILDEAGWRREAWKTIGGYGNTTQNKETKTRGQNNRMREVIWYSPHCRTAGTLFDQP